ncbi:MAG: phage/plasmid primase, P4 family [Armatimonadia bacterium]
MTDHKSVISAVDRAEDLSGGAHHMSDHDADDPGEITADGLEVDWELLKACAAEPQNDIGNSNRLRLRYGRELIHVQNVGWHAWEGRRWEEDVDGRQTRPFCHKCVAMILLEPLVILPTPDEQAAINKAEDAITPLAAARARLSELTAKEEDERHRLRVEVNALEDAISKGRKAHQAVADRRARRRRFAVSSGNSGKISGMLNESVAYVTKPIDDLDKEPLALNVANGTLRFGLIEEEDPDCPDPDVRRMKQVAQVRLDPHRREDLLTKLADVEYLPEAKAPVFEGFVGDVLPNSAVQRFVQRYLGYCLTALTREQVFAIFHGEGRNGKSTLVDVVARILGDYSTSVPISTLVNDNRSGKGSEATPDLARLPGARFVRTAEPREGLSFDESLIKGLTSGEPLPVRRLNQDFNDIYPTFKLAISVNRKPTIRGNDDGIWRRVLLVPFDVQIPVDKIDKQLSEKLWAERSGILNWLIAGLREYLEMGGLHPPEEVRAATQEYREESDMIGSFVRAALEITRSEYDQVEAGRLYSVFVAYCKRQGITPLSGTTFNRRLPKAASQFGFTKQKSSISVYCGLRVNGEFAVSSYTADGDPSG